MDSRRLGRVHIIDTNRQPEKCIFGSGCTIADSIDIGAIHIRLDQGDRRPRDVMVTIRGGGELLLTNYISLCTDPGYDVIRLCGETDCGSLRGAYNVEYWRLRLQH